MTLRRSFLALVALALLMGGARELLGHATLLSSEPAADSVLTTSPAEIRLVFSEPLEPALGRITLIASDGRSIPIAATGDPRNVRALLGAIPTLPPGGYRVSWRVVSADGHPVEGSFTFSVDGSSVVATPPPPPPHPVDEGAAVWGPSAAEAPLVPSLFRGLALGSLMALTGLLYFLGSVSTRPPRAMRVATVLAIGAPVLLAAHWATWLINLSPDHRLTGEWISQSMTGWLARVEATRTVLTILALWALVLARRVRLAFAFAAAALLVSGATGHAAAVQAGIATPAKALHLAGVAIWLGGIVWLIIAAASSTEDYLRSTRRVSSHALIAVLVVAITGLVQAVLFVPSVSAFFSSAYGATTLAKVAGLGLLVLFGAHHRFRVIPVLEKPDTRHRFARSLRAETLVMLVVVLLGGFLAYVPPPPGPSAQPAYSDNSQ